MCTYIHVVYIFLFQMKFRLARNAGRLSNSSGKSVQCFPVYSLLLALNRTTVDYFSLDVEGSELQVLKTIPFDKVDIKVLTVEFVHSAGGKKTLEEFMSQKGYLSVTELLHPAGLANDIVFVKIK